MVRWRELKSLEDELASFGVRSQELSAERLRAFPEVLWVLYGQEHLDNSDALEEASEHVETVIRRFIDSLKDQTDQRVAEAFLATTKQFQRKTVDDRVRELKNAEQIPPGLYRSRRNVLKREIAAELRRSLVPEVIKQNQTKQLSPEVREAARQLYRYAQETLLYVEAYDYAAHTIETLRDVGHYATARQIIRSACCTSDSALWAHAHWLEYLRILQHDHEGSAFLREGLPTSWWRYQPMFPFSDSEENELCLAVSEAKADEPGAFIEVLCELEYGKEKRTDWAGCLAAPEPLEPGFHPSKQDRDRLRNRLVTVCLFLKDVFPDDIMPVSEVGEEFWMVFDYLTTGLRIELLAPHHDEEGLRVLAVVNDAQLNRPLMHLFGEVEDISISACPLNR